MNNIIRYINYFEKIKQSPVFEYKKYFIDCLLINGAPAIANNSFENINFNKTYFNINKSSYYIPVIKIYNEHKLIFNSFGSNSQCIEKVEYSSLHSKKIEVKTHIYGDAIIELLHYDIDRKVFKQLFLIQFNTLFLNEDCFNSRFSKTNIDGISKDIRYPSEFYIDIFYNNEKNIPMSVYEKNISEFKSVMSNFLKNVINDKKCNKIINNNKDIYDNKKEIIDNLSNNNKNEKDLKDVKDIINNNTDIKNTKTSSNDDDEDLDEYLKNLESKA